MNQLLDKLNDRQREAVLQTSGPVLILAGAGSGKTTVLVNRIAYILNNVGVRPYRVLAITFTNKAANEMRERITNLIGDVANDMWIGTFHSICVRILRRTIDRLGYEKNFVIYDTADSKTVMKECMKELNIDDKLYPIRAVLSAISKAKDDLMDPLIFESVYRSDFRMSKIGELYTLYQKKLKKNNALDFDDIVLNAVKVLTENPDVLADYQSRFEYILVDEYQDTNNSQYMLISMLSQEYRNLCVVGDDDQSIYKFRGANIRNILDFEKEFPDAKIIKLEQNYRSTQNILKAANQVISNNKGRKGKDLWTDNDVGEKITLYTATNEHDEAYYIAKSISNLVESGDKKYSDFAILYRTNAQSRVIEEMLLKQPVPYRVLAGLRFYDRKEIKDIIAYLRCIHNPHDDVSLKRIINEPKRSIGATTVERMQLLADERDVSVFNICVNVDMFENLSRAGGKIKSFTNLINDFRKSADILSLSELVTKVMNDSGYVAMLQMENTVEAQTRIENLNEFMSVVKEHERTLDDANLTTFLESVTLVSDIDSYDEDQDACVLMTIHSAKGLEFPAVFLAGLEEGIFPGKRSIESEEELEEERRLCYVAITRAKKKLYITNTQSRTLYGITAPSRASRFLKEIPVEYIDEKTPIMKRITRDINDYMGKKILSTYKKPGENVFNKMSVTKEPIPEIMKFRAGDVVKHKKFGRGMIISAQQFGNDAKLEIAFDSVGTKILMAVFAKLEKID